ncbi:MMPL family transporter [Streptomyces geysiriensis]|uniref:MMPL family transporter n=1 Tax=Streptomyces geysiriensis TaxID=68207 RepID=UPI0027E0BF85|nr:MMPL family transporter [Streptomyces geysiriensis]
MATFLYKLGRLAFRRRHFVALIWVALLTLAGVGAASAPPAGTTSFSIPGTEAQKAFDLLEERFPGAAADGATARVVFKAPDGEKMTDPDNKAAVEKTVADLADGSEVASVADPYQGNAVSQDGTIAYASVKYDVSGMELEDSTKDALEDAAQQARDAGLTVEIGGDALQAVPHTGATEVIGIAVAAVVLVITFGSLVAAGLPLLTALIGVGIGVSSITALASALELGSTTSILAMMIGLAVGIDYALFIVSRYRAELAEGREREEAAGRAVGTAGSAVVFAGLTVVIALVGLAVVNIPMLTKMGIAAAGTVAIAVVIALTMVPALLGYAGRRVKPAGAKGRLLGRGRKSADQATEQTEGAQPKANLGTRWARFVVRRPVAVLLLGVVGLGAAAVPAASLELGLPDDGSQPTSTTQRRAYDLLSEGFGPGFNGPLMVVVDAQGSDAPQQVFTDVSDEIKGLDDVMAVTPPQPNKGGDTATITVVPDSKPSSVATEDLVHAIRDAGGDIRADTGAETLVTGSTAMNIDVSQKLNDALLPYLVLVVGLAFLLLIVVFRSGAGGAPRPHTTGCHVAALEYLATASPGAHRECLEFAETAAQDAPEDSLVRALPLRAAFTFLTADGDGAPAGALRTRLDAAADRAIAVSAAQPPADPWPAGLRNLLAYVLVRLERFPDAAEQLRLTGPYVTSFPWDRDADDPLGRFLQVRADVRAAVASAPGRAGPGGPRNGRGGRVRPDDH